MSRFARKEWSPEREERVRRRIIRMVSRWSKDAEYINKQFGEWDAESTSTLTEISRNLETSIAYGARLTDPDNHEIRSEVRKRAEANDPVLSDRERALTTGGSSDGR